MTPTSRLRIALFAAALAASSTLHAADKCAVKAVLNGKPVAFKSCTVAVYDEKGVTLLLTEAPLSADETSTFQLNSYPPEKDSSGKRRAILSFAFCAVDEKGALNPAAVKSVEVSANDGVSLVGLQDVFELPAAKANLKIEKLTGDLKKGGRLAGKITGSKTVEETGTDGQARKVPNSWDVDFDVALPPKVAAAGPGCGD
jgi:hypothetical protein